MASHPLLLDVLQSLRSDECGSFLLPVELKYRLVEKAQAIEHGDSLYGFISDALQFAHVLRTQKKSPRAAQALVDVVGQLLPTLESLVRSDVGSTSADPGERLARIKQTVDAEKSALASSQGEILPSPSPRSGGVRLRRT